MAALQTVGLQLGPLRVNSARQTLLRPPNVLGSQTREQVLVEQLVAQAPVEALRERVLDRLAALDVVPAHSVLLLPVQHRQARQLRAVVADDRRGCGLGGDRPLALAPPAKSNRSRTASGRLVL